MYCSNCGQKVDDNAVVCVNCGCAINKPANTKKEHGESKALLGVIAALFLGLIGLLIGVLAYPDITYSDGAILSKEAFDKIPYIGTPLLTFGIITFAFSTILGWCYYGEKAMEYLKGKRWMLVYRAVFIAMVFVGAVVHLSMVWNLADIANALMAKEMEKWMEREED